MIENKGIVHHQTFTDKHGANGRIERIHREIRQAMHKNTQKRSQKELISEFIKKYNNSHHRGIEMTPDEAWEEPDNKNQKK